jgi:hypothetical protein
VTPDFDGLVASMRAQLAGERGKQEGIVDRRVQPIGEHLARS